MRCSTARTTAPRAAVAAAAISLTTGAHGGVDGPLVLGDIVGIGLTRPAMATTSDGATWVAWIDSQCFGALRVQRIDAGGALLVPGGVELDLPDDCNSISCRITACPDDTVVVSAGPHHPAPPSRIDATGADLWQGGIDLPLGGAISGMHTLEGGDVLFAWHLGTSIIVARHAPDGTSVWGAPMTVSTVGGANKRIFAVLGDDAGGAYVFWDEPLKYVRQIRVVRVGPDGAPVWDAPFLVVAADGPPSFAGSSRHTDPVAIEDGRGGAVLAWTFGAESPGTPVPVLVQVVNPDGTGAFEPQGRRVSLSPERQFDVRLALDPASGDTLVGWRDDVAADQALRAQRLTPAGVRAWGDGGVAVTPLETAVAYQYDVAWNGGSLSLVVVDASSGPGDATVQLHRLDGAGVAAGPPIPISGETGSAPMRVIPVGDDVVTAWMDAPGSGHVLAARIDGGAPPVPGDTNGDGAVDVSDLVRVILDWGTDGTVHGGDVTGDGSVDVADLVAVIVGWTG